MPNLPSVGLCQQLRLVHVDALAGGQHLDHLLVLPLLGHAVMDRHAKAAGQRQLFLHGIGAVDVTVVFHVCPVIPGLPDQVTAVRGGIDQYIVRAGLNTAFNHRLQKLVLHLVLFKGEIVDEDNKAVISVLNLC